MTADVEHSAPSHRPAGHSLFVVFGAIFVTLVGLTVVLLYLHRAAVERDKRGQLEHEAARGPRIRVAQATTTTGDRTVELPGDVHGYDQTTLYAKLSGYIKEIRVNRGDHVAKNQVLAIIESPETREDVRSAENSATIAKVTAHRFDDLVPAGVVSQQDRDTADAQRQISQSMLGRARALLEYAVVRAPFEGIVTARYVDPGALVPAATGSTQSALPIVDMASIDTLRVFVYVGQDAAAFVTKGDKAEVWQDELPARRIPAQVTYTAGALDPRTRTMQVEVDFDNRHWGMLPGTFAQVQIHIVEPKAVLISSETLVIRDGKTMVAEIRDGHAHYVNVDLGYNDGRNVRVMHGLSGGETIAVNPPVELAEGDVVEVAPPSGSP